jgi:hypothetical protein
MVSYRGVGIRKAVLAWGVADWQVLRTGLALLGFTRFLRFSAELHTEAPWGVGIISFKLFKLFLYFVINCNRIGPYLAVRLNI